MAGATRTPFLHVGHAFPCALFAGLEYLVMALNACVHAFVDGMAEGGDAGFLHIENHIDGGFVTLVTITFYAEHR